MHDQYWNIMRRSGLIRIGVCANPILLNNRAATVQDAVRTPAIAQVDSDGVTTVGLVIR
jgi:hypothetical protein